jgi:hypothetical protein
MALSDRLKDVTSASVCVFQQMLNKMPKEDLEALAQAFKDGLPWRAIQRALRAEGYKTSTEAMSSHRKGTCRCPK